MKFRLRGKTYEGSSFAELSKMYCSLRQESDEGASTFPTPKIYNKGVEVGSFSYNGKVWSGNVLKFDSNGE